MRRARWSVISACLCWMGAAACGDDRVPDALKSTAGTSTGAGGEGGGGIVCPPSGVLRGPWSMRIEATSAVVRWDGCAPSSADVLLTPEAGGAAMTVTGTQTAAEVTTRFDALQGVAPDLPGTYYLTEVALADLAPGTCYRYASVADPATEGRFCTARPSGDGFRFMAIGDTNPTLGDSTAKVLAAALPENPDFVMHVGDIQYYASVFESWALWFPLMAPMLRQGAFFPAIGNHEAEIPGEFEDYYLRLFGGAGKGGTPEYWRFESGGVWFFAMNTEESLDPGSAQGLWLEAQLADAAAQPGYRFSIVYFHKPWITLSEYSQDRTARDYYKPIFVSHKVRLVVQGHVHGYERFEDGEITYLTTGGGGALLHGLDDNVEERPDEAALRVAKAAVHHAILFDVDATGITGRVIAEDGAIADSFTHAVP